MPYKEGISETSRQHKINAYLGASLAVSIGYLAGVVTPWFLLLLIIPAFILWVSATWMVRGGFMLAIVMNQQEQLEEMNQWLQDPIERVLMEKRKNGAASSSS